MNELSTVGVAMPNYNQTGRSKSDRFVALSYRLLTSHAWLYLPPGAAKIYIELKRRYNGSNNGEISLSCREAAGVALCSKSTAKKHLDTLQAHGFIELSKPGLMKYRYAATWFLTEQASALSKQYPTNTWKNFKYVDLGEENRPTVRKTGAAVPVMKPDGSVRRPYTNYSSATQPVSNITEH